jgi:hypothetical protein
MMSIFPCFLCFADIKLLGAGVLVAIAAGGAVSQNSNSKPVPPPSARFAPAAPKPAAPAAAAPAGTLPKVAEARAWIAAWKAKSGKQ